MTATWAQKLGRKTATWALKAWEQTKAEVESEQPLGSGLQHIFLSPSGFLQLVCFRWVRPGSLAEQQKTYIYIYMFLWWERFGTKQFLECIVYTLDESHMGIEFGMKQPLGSIWRKSMQSQESGMESGSSLARGAASLSCGGLLLLWQQSPCAW